MRYAVPVVLGVVAVTGCEQLLDLQPQHVIDATASDTAAPDAAAIVDGPPPDPCVQPFAYYAFEDASALVDVGGHYDGMVSTPAPALGAGKRGSAFVFGGSGSAFASLDYPSAFQRTPLTVSLWFDPTDTGNTHCLVNQLRTQGGSKYGDSWQLCIAGDKMELLDDSGFNLQFGSANTGLWQHVAIVLDGSNATLWLDQASIGSPFVPTYDHVSPILIGADSDTAMQLTAAYAGSIDELKFFACALTGAQLSQL